MFRDVTLVSDLYAYSNSNVSISELKQSTKIDRHEGRNEGSTLVAKIKRYCRIEILVPNYGSHHNIVMSL